ncbi:MAG: FAD-dependent oxidoreductase [Pseudomonadota bacterium]
MRIVIVGGGVMGLCSAWALHRAGHKIVLYEQGPLPNPLSSSCDQHRLIRYTYGAKIGYAQMVVEAYKAWHRLWDDLGRSHYRETGTLAVARDHDGWVTESLDTMAAMGLPYEVWQPARVAERLPFLELSTAHFALYAPSGGALLAEPILVDLAEYLRRRGAELRTQTRILEIDAGRASVKLADGQEDSGDLLIVAAGPWTDRLLPALAQRVTPSRQILAYLEPPHDHRDAWRNAPMLLDQVEAARGGFYVVPPVGDTDLKVGDHGFSLEGQPDRDREATEGDIASVLEVASKRFAGFERYRLMRAHTCFYSVTETESFIVEPIDHAWVLAGFSGHGFKFGAVIGEMLASTLEGARTSAALTAWAAGQI